MNVALIYRREVVETRPCVRPRHVACKALPQASYPGRTTATKQGHPGAALTFRPACLATPVRTAVVCHCLQGPEGSERRKGSQLRQLILDINSCSNSPTALKKLKELQFASRHEVEECLPEIEQCINGVLQHSTRRSVRNIPQDLFQFARTFSKAAMKHPSILAMLQTGSHRNTVLGMVQACAKDGAVYRNAFSVSQLCSAQYDLQIYCEEFWQCVSQEHISKWDAKVASSVVYAYGKLRSSGAAPDAPDSLKRLLRASVLKHVTELTPQGVANVAWSLAKQGMLNGDVLLPLQERARDTATDMKAQEVANTLWAFATAGQKLGCAEGDLLKAVVRVSCDVSGSASYMNSQDVAHIFWAFATLELELGEAHEPLMKQIVRVVGRMNAQDVANTLWAVGRLRVVLGAAHDGLLQAVPRVSTSFEAIGIDQTTVGLDWLKGQDGSSADMQLAVEAIEAARERLRGAA